MPDSIGPAQLLVEGKDDRHSRWDKPLPRKFLTIINH